LGQGIEFYCQMQGESWIWELRSSEVSLAETWLTPKMSNILPEVVQAGGYESECDVGLDYACGHRSHTQHSELASYKNENDYSKPDFFINER